MDVLYRAILIAQSATGQPQGSVPDGYDGNVGGVIGNGSNASGVDTISLLEKLYKLAFNLLNNILKLMDFPNITESNSKGNWYCLWEASKVCFNEMLNVAIPIATIFFIIAIYKSVVSKPPEEQPKEFFIEAVRYMFIIFIISNLFNMLTLITEAADGVTDAVLNYKDFNPKVAANDTGQKYADYGIDYDNSTIKAYLNKFCVEDKDSHNIKKYEDKNVLDFFVDMFQYIFLFFGGLATLLIFGVAGYTIVMSTIQRIVKPLAMLPFSTIIVGMGACSGDGERAISNFVKKLIQHCLSGVFIILALKMGSLLARMDLFDVGSKWAIGEKNILWAFAGILNVNLPVILTTGLVKSSETFMEKVF